MLAHSPIPPATLKLPPSLRAHTHSPAACCSGAASQFHHTSQCFSTLHSEGKECWKIRWVVHLSSCLLPRESPGTVSGCWIKTEPIHPSIHHHPSTHLPLCFHIIFFLSKFIHSCANYLFQRGSSTDISCSGTLSGLRCQIFLFWPNFENIIF